jgi:hypothetical protein
MAHPKIQAQTTTYTLCQQLSHVKAPARDAWANIRGKVDSLQIQDSEPDVRNQYETSIGKHQCYGGEFSIRAKSPMRSPTQEARLTP